MAEVIPWDEASKEAQKRKQEREVRRQAALDKKKKQPDLDTSVWPWGPPPPDDKPTG